MNISSLETCLQVLHGEPIKDYDLVYQLGFGEHRIYIEKDKPAEEEIRKKALEIMCNVFYDMKDEINDLKESVNDLKDSLRYLKDLQNL